MDTTLNKRLDSLDVLRGFDLFCLVVLETILHPLARAVDTSWFDSFMWGFTHVQWEGFSSWDLVMPLFLFMTGVSIPFALSKYKMADNKKAVYWRIAKRVILLWLLGMICQGNLLAFDPDRIYLYTNTLQSIAVGYLIASVLFLHLRLSKLIMAAIFLLLIYWGAMQWISVGGFGAGLYTPDGNLAEWVDRVVLGRFRDGATVVQGEVIFAPWYRYTWVLSSLNFGVTVLTGVFAGSLLKDRRRLQAFKLRVLFGAGVAMVVVGWLWGLQMPVIKKLWTGSMVLVSSGYCFLLMGLFFYWIDCKGHRKGTTWLKVYGMNSILAYMLTCVVSFKCIGHSLFFGTQQFLGDYYPVLMALCNVSVIFLILYWFYKKGIFVRV